MIRDLSSTHLELKEPLIVLTVPKSGTHLITNILREIFGEARVDPGMIAAEKIPPGIGDTPYIYHTHLIYSPATSLALRRVRKVLLVRDPRDVAASFTRAIYNRKIPPDNVQSYLLQNGFSLDEILSFVIQGGTIGGSTYPDLGSLYRLYYWGWRATTELVLHYENLLPDRGDFSGPETAIRNLLASLDIDVPEDFPLAERIREGSAPERSQTFDRGRARSWETDFALMSSSNTQGAVIPALVRSGWRASQLQNRRTVVLQPRAAVPAQRPSRSVTFRSNGLRC